MILAEGAFDTRMMRAVPGLLVKGGAESVMLASLADGSAIAWKISDGANRANGPMMKAALAKLGKTIEGVTWQIMQGMGHFPMSEDPDKFLTYLKPVLQQALLARKA